MRSSVNPSTGIERQACLSWSHTTIRLSVVLRPVPYSSPTSAKRHHIWRTSPLLRLMKVQPKNRPAVARIKREACCGVIAIGSLAEQGPARLVE